MIEGQFEDAPEETMMASAPWMNNRDNGSSDVASEIPPTSSSFMHQAMHLAAAAPSAPLLSSMKYQQVLAAQDVASVVSAEDSDDDKSHSWSSLPAVSSGPVSGLVCDVSAAAAAIAIATLSASAHAAIANKNNGNSSNNSSNNNKTINTINAPVVTVPPASVEKKEKSVFYDLGENDVLCGRGKGANNTTGNRRYRELIAAYRRDYVAAHKRGDKRAVCEQIIRIVHARGGRFVERTKHGLWAEIARDKALLKTSQALREPIVRKCNLVRLKQELHQQQQIAASAVLLHQQQHFAAQQQQRRMGGASTTTNFVPCFLS